MPGALPSLSLCSRRHGSAAGTASRLPAAGESCTVPYLPLRSTSHGQTALDSATASACLCTCTSTCPCPLACRRTAGGAAASRRRTWPRCGSPPGAACCRSTSRCCWTVAAPWAPAGRATPRRSCSCTMAPRTGPPAAAAAAAAAAVASAQVLASQEQEGPTSLVCPRRWLRLWQRPP